jgi:hypothetical protein
MLKLCYKCLISIDCMQQSCRAISPLSESAESFSICLSRAKLLKVFCTPQNAILHTVYRHSMHYAGCIDNTKAYTEQGCQVVFNRSPFMQQPDIKQVYTQCTKTVNATHGYLWMDTAPSVTQHCLPCLMPAWYFACCISHHLRLTQASFKKNLLSQVNQTLKLDVGPCKLH